MYIIGDFNADLSDNNSLFARDLIEFCNENKLFLTSQLLLPNSSFTYVSDAWHTTSWLDHLICTADAHSSIVDMVINYDMAISDHIPISMLLNVDNIPALAPNDDSNNVSKLD